MLNADDKGLATVLGQTDPINWIEAVATGGACVVAIVGRQDVECYLGRPLTENEWDWLHESDPWRKPQALQPWIELGPFIDNALTVSDALAKAAEAD